MKQNIGDQINSVVNNLAEKLGVAVDKVYPTLIKQSYIDGIFGIFITIVMIIALILSIKGLIKNVPNMSKEKETTNQFDIKAIVCAIICFISVIGSMICFFSFKDYYTALFNPDWYALNMILDKLK